MYSAPCPLFFIHLFLHHSSPLYISLYLSSLLIFSPPRFSTRFLYSPLPYSLPFYLLLLSSFLPLISSRLIFSSLPSSPSQNFQVQGGRVRIVERNVESGTVHCSTTHTPPYTDRLSPNHYIPHTNRLSLLISMRYQSVISAYSIRTPLCQY